MAQVKASKGFQGARDAGIGALLAACGATILCHVVPELDYATAFTFCLVVGSALSRIGFNWLKHKRFERLGIVPLLMIAPLIALGLSGCARNSNMVAVGGTGAFIQTPFGLVALGNFEASITTIDAVDEAFEISDTQYFEATTDGIGESGTVGLDVKREYKASLSPVESTEVESGDDAVGIENP